MSGEGVAGVAGEEENTEYESDPEEAKSALVRRRKEASDDEQGDDGDGDGEERENSCSPPHPRSGAVDYDGESDGQGAADHYDDGEGEYYDDESDDEEVGKVYREVEVREAGGGEAEEKVEDGGEAEAKGDGDGDGDGDGEGEGEGEEKGEGEEGEQKEVEPFSVPTSGAFYMHDDRFRDNAGGRNRRTFGGRKLWESKDERKWGHDKFEELTVQERHYDEGRRSSKGPYRGRGKARGAGTGSGRGGGGRGRGRGYSGGNDNENPAPKDVRGRGPRRYQPLMKNNGETHPPQYKQSARSFVKSSRTGSGRTAVSTGSLNADHEAAPAKKAGSNLSSASPPFYPSGAATKDVAAPEKKEMHSGNHNRNIHPSVDPNFPIPISNPILRGKNVIDSTGIDKLCIDGTVSPPTPRAINNLHLRAPASSSSSPNQLAHPRGQGRVGASSRPAVYQPVQSNSQVNKVSLQATQASPRSPVQTQSQSTLPAPSQQLVQRPLVASQSSSPPKAGKGAFQGTGRGSLVYGGGQVMGSGGNAGAGHGDPNMPAFFPVMQFGGQHPGGMGVPAVGMAFPGYVAQPNGLGNSEMTWLPVLASAAGALGGTYPPYLTVDGNYPRPSGQTSALPAPSKDNNLGKPNNEIKPQQRSEVANDEFSQRQNKPRRYSEMNFSQ